MVGKHAHFDVTNGASFSKLLGACFDLDAKMNIQTPKRDFAQQLQLRMRRSANHSIILSSPSLVIQTVNEVRCKSTSVSSMIHEKDSETRTDNWLSFEEFRNHLAALDLNTNTVIRAINAANELDRAHMMATGHALAGEDSSYFLLHRNEMAELLWFLSALEELELESFTCSALPAFIDRPSLEQKPNTDILERPMLPSPYIMDELLIGMRICKPPKENGADVSPVLVATLKTLSMGEKGPDTFCPSYVGYGQSQQSESGDCTPCRVLVGELASAVTPAAAAKTETMTHLEANLDDTTGESLALAIELLLQNGAADAWVTPIVMKKGRPAHTLHCLSRPDASVVDSLLGIMFRQTTTLGIRVNRNVERVALQRRMTNVEWQDDNGIQRTTRVKIGFYQGMVVSVKPEFEDLRKVVLETGMPLKLASDKVISKAYKNKLHPG